MPKYLATGNYRSTLNGTREVVFRAGEAYDVEPGMVGPLIRDGAPIDFSAPLTADQLADIEQRKEHERLAAIEAERADAERLTAIRDHIRLWGSRCPGLAGMQIMPPGWVSASDTPHNAVGDSGLQAQHVDTDDGGWWAVGCPAHIDHLAAQDKPPTPPTYVDRTVRRYRAKRYSATFSDYTPEGSAFTRVPPDQQPKRYSFAEGQVVSLPTYIAEWIMRDSEGALVPLDEGEG